jgi:hypothetical protein
MTKASDPNKTANTPAGAWSRAVIITVFFVLVNVLAGYIAIELNYPSLYNVRASFSEYAIPLPFNWAFVHLASMLVYGLPLCLMHEWQPKTVAYCRIIFGCSFLLYFLELDGKNPFILFLKIDAISALAFSLLLVPPNRADNPGLVATLKILGYGGLLVLAAVLYWAQQHRAPTVSTRHYVDDMFKLESIVVYNDFRKTMLFYVEINKQLPADKACESGQILASDLLRDYPFDETYDKKIILTLYPQAATTKESTNEVGEISLRDQHKDEGGRFFCYVRLD